MAKLADDSESFESKMIFGLLCGAPDLLPNTKHIEEMFKPINGEGVCGCFNFGYIVVDFCFMFNWMIDADELIPQEGKDETYDEVVSEIHGLEQSLEADLKKFEKSLGYVNCQHLVDALF
jgi:DNA mismatch repair protein MSH6